jgi:glucokinase-like ROK family protein
VINSQPGLPRFRTGDSSLVRQINLSVILHHIYENSPISRAGLADITGLNKTTVSSLVSELIEAQLVREIGYDQGGSGRTAGRYAILLTLNPEAGFIVSGEIGVDFISVICSNFAPEILWRKKESTPPHMGQPAIINRALAIFSEAVEAGQSSGKSFLGLALGVPGLIDLEANKLLFAPNLAWRDVPLGEILRENFQTLVLVDNEARMAALGEYYFGAAHGAKEVLYISSGVGLGGGILYDGHLYRGISGVSNEIGHMTMDPDGELCSCGNRGCWETLVSQNALYRYIAKAVSEGQECLLTDRVDGDFTRLTVPMVLEAAEAGDSVILHALDCVGEKFGIGISSLVNALNPERVIFGGTMSIVGKFLLPRIEEEMKRRALRWNREATQLMLAHHGSDATTMGGIALVYETILEDPQNLAGIVGKMESNRLRPPGFRTEAKGGKTASITKNIQRLTGS